MFIRIKYTIQLHVHLSHHAQHTTDIKLTQCERKRLATYTMCKYNPGMATRVRNIVAELIEAGFTLKKGGKGSHRKYWHAKVA